MSYYLMMIFFEKIYHSFNTMIVIPCPLPSNRDINSSSGSTHSESDCVATGALIVIAVADRSPSLTESGSKFFRKNSSPSSNL